MHVNAERKILVGKEQRANVLVMLLKFPNMLAVSIPHIPEASLLRLRPDHLTTGPLAAGAGGTLIAYCQRFANRHVNHTSKLNINCPKTGMHQMVVGQHNLYNGLVHHCGQMASFQSLSNRLELC